MRFSSLTEVSTRPVALVKCELYGGMHFLVCNIQYAVVSVKSALFTFEFSMECRGRIVSVWYSALTYFVVCTSEFDLYMERFFKRYFKQDT